MAKAITVAFARISFNLACAVPFTTRMFVLWRFDSVEARTVQTLDPEEVYGPRVKLHDDVFEAWFQDGCSTRVWSARFPSVGKLAPV